MSASTLLQWHKFPPSQLGCAAALDARGRGVLTHTSAMLRAHPDIDFIFTGPIFKSPNIALRRLLDVPAAINLASRCNDPTDECRTVGATISVLDNTAYIHEADEIHPGAQVAIQGVFTIQNSAVQMPDGSTYVYPDKPGQSDNERVWRCAIGLLSNGEVCFAIGKNSLHGFAVSVRDADYDGARAVRFLYTDGGSSGIFRNRSGSILRGFSGDDAAIFNWCVVRSGPATPMQVMNDPPGRSSSQNFSPAPPSTTNNDLFVPSALAKIYTVGVGVGVSISIAGVYYLWRRYSKKPGHKRSSR